MTETEIIILAVGGAALLIALAVLIYKWIRHRFYEYNECTGRVELKSKIKADSERARQEYEARQKKIAEQRAMETGVDLKDPRKFRPRDENHEDLVYAKVMQKGTQNGRFAILFHDVTYDEDIPLFVDEGTYNKVEVGTYGTLCYNYKHSIFHYYKTDDYLFKK